MSRVAVETIPVLTQASFAVVKTISPSAFPVIRFSELDKTGLNNDGYIVLDSLSSISEVTKVKNSGVFGTHVTATESIPS